MKSYYILSLFFLYGCIHNTPKPVNMDEIPWYISMPDSVIMHYNVRDSLDRFFRYFNKKTSPHNVICYLADLEYSNGNIEKARQLLEKSLDEDLDKTVENYLMPIYDYLFIKRPQRLNSIPPIVMKDFTHFAILCQKYLSEKRSPVDYHLILLGKIRVLDQWFRVPQREMNPDIQIKYDSICQSILDSEFYTIDLSTLNKSRDMFYVVILHAMDCKWTERWIMKYAEDFKNDKFIIEHLNHFLYRSDCRDIPSINIAVKARINQLKK